MKYWTGIILLITACLAARHWTAPHDAEGSLELTDSAGPRETAVFSGGCFWGLQAAFDDLPGVIRTRVGYTGGELENPTYQQVITGRTGHAEAVEVVFDPTRTSYSELLHHFFARHRPALGAQSTSYATKHYRSAIFVANDGQRQIAENVIAAVNDSGRFPAPVATRIEPAATFWEAEAEHQNYLARCSY
ncbi:MAG TPA: peptide-methionine (S)-S-oxide reductase [Verrucomicrobiales bacterium]|nr:peptide-methionine (S)-S-oxide reductase [Verrucomicrobiales bacterium]